MDQKLNDAGKLQTPHWFVGEWDHTWSWNEDGRMEVKCRVIVDLANKKLVTAQVWGYESWCDANPDQTDDLAKSLLVVNKVSVDPRGFDLFEIDRLPTWAASAAGEKQLPPYQNDEVIGLDKGGCVVQWDCDNGMPARSGESLEEFGLHGLREHELARVGVTREAWEAAVAEQARKMLEAKSGDGANITSYCQRVCGGECGTGPVCKYEVDPLTEMPVFSNHLGVAQEGLELSTAEHAGHMLATMKLPEKRERALVEHLLTEQQRIDTLRQALEVIAVGDTPNAKVVAEAALQEVGIWAKPDEKLPESNAAQTLWDRDDIQFPRLLAEIMATQTLDMSTLADSMDLTIDEVNSLFDRADQAWEAIKAETAPLQQH